jgi:hypothetical protein
MRHDPARGPPFPHTACRARRVAQMPPTPPNRPISGLPIPLACASLGVSAISQTSTALRASHSATSTTSTRDRIVCRAASLSSRLSRRPRPQASTPARSHRATCVEWQTHRRGGHRRHARGGCPGRLPGRNHGSRQTWSAPATMGLPAPVDAPPAVLLARAAATSTQDEWATAARPANAAFGGPIQPSIAAALFRCDVCDEPPRTGPVLSPYLYLRRRPLWLERARVHRFIRCIWRLSGSALAFSQPRPYTILLTGLHGPLASPRRHRRPFARLAIDAGSTA